jgi:hypothetical protein
MEGIKPISCRNPHVRTFPIEKSLPGIRLGRYPSWIQVSLSLTDRQEALLKRILDIEGVREITADSRSGLTITKSPAFGWKRISEELSSVFGEFDCGLLDLSPDLEEKAPMPLFLEEDDTRAAFHIAKELCRSDGTGYDQWIWPFIQSDDLFDRLPGAGFAELIFSQFGPKEVPRLCVSSYRLDLTKGRWGRKLDPDRLEVIKRQLCDFLGEPGPFKRRQQEPKNGSLERPLPQKVKAI